MKILTQMYMDLSCGHLGTDHVVGNIKIKKITTDPNTG